MTIFYEFEGNIAFSQCHIHNNNQQQYRFSNFIVCLCCTIMQNG